MTGNRVDALARLDVFVGEWVMEARFAGGQPATSSPAEDGVTARFTGTFSEDGNTISGAWEICPGGGEWAHDFALTYHRVG